MIKSMLITLIRSLNNNNNATYLNYETSYVSLNNLRRQLNYEPEPYDREVDAVVINHWCTDHPELEMVKGYRDKYVLHLYFHLNRYAQNGEKYGSIIGFFSNTESTFLDTNFLSTTTSNV
jgi:hypothetical protein